MPHDVVRNQRRPNRIPTDTYYFCPACAAEEMIRLDRKGRPFWYCSFCGLRCFFRTHLAEYGWMLLQSVISVNAVRMRRAVLEADFRERRARIKHMKNRDVIIRRARRDMELGLAPTEPLPTRNLPVTPAQRGYTLIERTGE